MLSGCTGFPLSGKSGGVDLDKFCERGLELLEPVPRPFIGTADHVAQFTALREVAPEELVDKIALMEAHYDTAVDPGNPESQNFDNFPQPVQDAAVYLTDEINARCEVPE